MECVALAEAIGHLARGLEVGERLPPSPKRDQAELELTKNLKVAKVLLDELRPG